MVDWSKPLRIKGTDREAWVVSGPDGYGKRRVKADWFGHGQVVPLYVGADGVMLAGMLGVELENIPEPAADPDLNLRIAREAAARVYEADGFTVNAKVARAGDGDGHMSIQAALLALTEGARLLETDNDAS